MDGSTKGTRRGGTSYIKSDSLYRWYFLCSVNIESDPPKRVTETPDARSTWALSVDVASDRHLVICGMESASLGSEEMSTTMRVRNHPERDDG